MTLWRRILMESSRLSSPLSAKLNFSGGIASFSSKSIHYFGRGYEKRVEKLEEEIGELRVPDTMSLSSSEIGATASVLLGFAPPSTLTATSSSKLNEVLVPNPFDRPRALLMVEVAGAEDSQLLAHSDNSLSSNTLRIKVDGNQRVDIQLPDEDEISMFSLNEVSSNAECSDKELNDFASWLGGSYIEDASQALNGELLIPIANGAFMRLHMSERADRDFATSLVLLISNMRKAMELHQVFTKSERSPAELITGRFDGIKRNQFGLWKPRAEHVNFPQQQRRYFHVLLEHKKVVSFTAFFTWALARSRYYPKTKHKFHENFYFHFFEPHEVKGWMTGKENPLQSGFDDVLIEIGMTENEAVSIWGHLVDPDSKKACDLFTRRRWIKHARDRGIDISHERFLSLGYTFAKKVREVLMETFAADGIVVGIKYPMAVFLQSVKTATLKLESMDTAKSLRVYSTLHLLYPRQGALDIDSLELNVAWGKEIVGLNDFKGPKPPRPKKGKKPPKPLDCSRYPWILRSKASVV